MAVLNGIEEVRNDAVNMRTRGQRLVGHRPHQANAPTAVDDLEASSPQHGSEASGRIVVGLSQRIAGRSVHGHSPYVIWHRFERGSHISLRR